VCCSFLRRTRQVVLELLTSPRPSPGTCFLATASVELGGHPFGSVVDVAVDARGRPLLCISTLSGHTRDLAADARCSLTVQQPGFAGIQDGRCTLVGTCAKVRPPVQRVGTRHTREIT
jgi:hypothetical protein